MKETTRKSRLMDENEKLKKRIKELEDQLDKNNFTEKDNSILGRKDLYYAIFDKNLAIKLLIDPENGDIIDANSSACQFYGYTLEEIKTKKIMDINIHTFEQIEKEMLEAKSEKRNYFIFKHKLANNELRDVEVYSSPVIINDKKLLFSIINDITEKKLTEASLIQSNQALMQQQKIFNAILSTTSDHFIVYDEKGRHLYVNKAGLEAQGLKPENVIGKTWRDLGFPEEAGNMFENCLFNVFHHRKSINFEAQFPTVNGIRDWEVFYTPLYNCQGNIDSMLATYRDITERKISDNMIKESLAEKEVLLKEIHHRVKNNLQVISSLIHLQSNSVKDENVLGVLKESHNRIKSMSLVHEKLYQSSNISKICFKEYINSLVNNIFQSYGTTVDKIRLNLNISENITLNIDTTIVWGLIINELVSNTLKYAFPIDIPEIQKEIIIELIFNSDTNFILIFSDNGVGFPNKVNFKNPKSLGLQLVNLLVEQLGAEIKLEDAKGVNFKISLGNSINQI